jgi:DNA-binding response OmpR family regulator
MSAKRVRVVFVDDDDVNLITFGTLLEEASYDVTTARNVDEARALIADGGFDLAVLDMHVGKELGTALIPVLRESCPGIAVVILSGSLTTELVTGADLVLGKASDPAETLAKLDVLRRARERRGGT